MKFFDEVNLEFSTNPHSKLKSDITMNIGSTISACGSFQTNSNGFFNPFFHTDFIIVQSGLTFNYGEFAIIKSGIAKKGIPCCIYNVYLCFMQIKSQNNSQIKNVTTFDELITHPFEGDVNAICWNRALQGNFKEIVQKLHKQGNITEISSIDLLALELSEHGKLAREIILNDLALLQKHGALPSLNLIEYYERDEVNAIFPTDVYSFHVDSAPVPSSTFLCTYFGEASEILPNAQAIKKVLIPSIREGLRKEFNGNDLAFELFLSENFYDLHYEALAHACPINLGTGNLWRLAILHPESKVLPCIHRAPKEKEGELRLMLIC